MALKLNLVSLTSSELERLLGQAGARQIQPDLSAARLSNRSLLWDSPFFQEHFVLWPAPETNSQADPQTQMGQSSGKTPEANRRIRALQAELEQIGAEFLGRFSLQQISGDRKIAAYLVPSAIWPLPCVGASKIPIPPNPLCKPSRGCAKKWRGSKGYRLGM